MRIFPTTFGKCTDALEARTPKISVAIRPRRPVEAFEVFRVVSRGR